jgi:hypothetical protein
VPRKFVSLVADDTKPGSAPGNLPGTDLTYETTFDLTAQRQFGVTGAMGQAT